MRRDMGTTGGSDGGGGAGAPLSAHEAAQLAMGIAGLAASGLPMPGGLRATAEEHGRGPLRDSLEALASLLESGEPLERAVESQAGRFPAHIRGLLRVGAGSGTLGTLLGRYLEYREVGASLRWRTWIALAYPLLSILAAVVLFVLVSFLLEYGFAPLYADFGIRAPVATRLVLRVSHVIAGGGWTPLAAAGVLALLVALGSFAVPLARRRALIGYLPAVGWIWRWTALSEFCHTLGLLLEGGVPVGQAVRLSGDGVQDAAIARASARVAREVEGGRPLSQELALQRIFPQGLARLVEWSSGGPPLPEVLHLAGDMYAARARAQASFVGVVYGVASVIAVLFGIGFVIVSVFLPMITLISKLSG